MITHLAAGAANCNTGTWQQKWNCGWHEGTSSAVPQAGYNFGHSVLPVLLVLLAVVFLVRAVRKRAKGSSASPARARR